MSTTDLPGSSLLAGRYRLVERLGAGGMSVVWRGFDEVLGRQVAVKVLPPSTSADPSFRRRLRAEAQAAARLSHPHITNVYDYGEATTVDGEPVPYVVMELIDGESLAAVLARVRRLPWQAAVRITSEVAAALAAAHSRGIVHRDVTPANVMLTQSGAKVVDFGISALIGENDIDPDGSLLGTPAYLAPERLEGGQVSPATDVYAVGLLIYRTLIGQLPWDVGTTTALLRAHQYTEPEPLPPVEGLPPAVTALVGRCLEKRPADRPSSAELAHVLAGIAAGAPMTSRGYAADWSSESGEDTTILPSRRSYTDAFAGGRFGRDSRDERDDLDRRDGNDIGEDFERSDAEVAALPVAAAAAFAGGLAAASGAPAAVGALSSGSAAGSGASVSLAPAGGSAPSAGPAASAGPASSAGPGASVGPAASAGPAASGGPAASIGPVAASGPGASGARAPSGAGPSPDGSTPGPGEGVGDQSGPLAGAAARNSRFAALRSGPLLNTPPSSPGGAPEGPALRPAFGNQPAASAAEAKDSGSRNARRPRAGSAHTRRVLLVAAAVLLLTGGMYGWSLVSGTDEHKASGAAPPLPQPSVVPPSGKCVVSYAVWSDANGKFSAQVTLANRNDTAVKNWKLWFILPGDQTISGNGKVALTQKANTVTVSSRSALSPQKAVILPITGRYAKRNAPPLAFSLNGATCETFVSSKPGEPSRQVEHLSDGQVRLGSTPSTTTPVPGISIDPVGIVHITPTTPPATKPGGLPGTTPATIPTTTGAVEQPPDGTGGGTTGSVEPGPPTSESATDPTTDPTTAPVEITTTVETPPTPTFTCDALGDDECITS
jgi:serine/threonine protein kinase